MAIERKGRKKNKISWFLICFVSLIFLVLTLVGVLIVNSVNCFDQQYLTLNNYFYPKLSPKDKEWVDYYSIQLQQKKFEKNYNETITKIFSDFLKFKTISYRDVKQVDFTEFKRQEEFIIQNFPNVFSVLERIRIQDDTNNDNYFILLKWEGLQTTLKPILFASHLDVVPIAPNTDHLWSTDPFNGTIIDQFIYGRGAIDDKFGIIGILSAIEQLLSFDKIFQPKRTIYIAFGHDEECSGIFGAKIVSQHLKSKGIQLEYVIDEGGLIMDSLPPLVNRPIALIATAEKGFATLNLTVIGDGGHSSMPPNETPIGILSKAIYRLESTQLRKSISGAFKDMLEFISSATSFPLKLVTTNLWFFSFFLTIPETQSTTINASMRTTIAPTVIVAGEKDNVLPKVASALINFRLITGDTSSSLVDDVNKIIDDPRVVITKELSSISEPSPVSPTTSFGWRVLQATINHLYPEVIVSPYLALGATDGRYYHEVTDNVYRFAPCHLNNKDLSRIHGIDERMSIEDVINSSEFYGKLIVFSQFDIPNFTLPKHNEL